MGIRVIANAFHNRLLTVDKRCTALIREMTGYGWDPEKEDTPLKTEDHSCDAMRYICVDRLPYQNITPIKLPKGM